MPYTYNLTCDASQPTLTISQQPPEYNKGFWGSFVTDTDIVLAGYLEKVASLPGRGVLDIAGRASLQLCAGPGLAGCLLSVLGAHVTITEQDEAKMVALRKNTARLEASGEPPSASLLPLKQVAADTDTKSSLPWSLIVSSDEYLLYDEESASTLVAALSRLSDTHTQIILAYGRNRNGEEEFLKCCAGLFNVCNVPYGDLHEVYRTMDEDVKVVLLRRTGASIAAGPWYSPRAATLVPASPHLQGRQAPRPNIVQRRQRRLREIQMSLALKKEIKKQQKKAFIGMPRRCRYPWWSAYCGMVRDRRSKAEYEEFITQYHARFGGVHDEEIPSDDEEI